MFFKIHFQFLILWIVLANINVNYALTEAQMQSTAKLIRNMCQPKNKVTDAQIADFHKGKFDESKGMMCYMHCVLGMMKILNKSGKIDIDSALAQIPTLPKKYQAPTERTLKECADKGTSNDKCEASYQISKCLFMKSDPPELYFLP